MKSISSHSSSISLSEKSSIPDWIQLIQKQLSRWILFSVRGIRNWIRRSPLKLVSIIIFIAIWHIGVANQWNFILNLTHMPSPWEVLVAAEKLVTSRLFYSHVFSSTARVFCGFGIAAILAILLGLLIGWFHWAEDLILTILEILRPIPAVAWIPLAILLFTTSEGSMVYITFVGAFFPILINTIDGVERTDKLLLRAARSLGANQFQIYTDVVFPSALPSIVSGLTIGMGNSWFSLVTAEMISGQFGIGYYTWESYNLVQYPPIVVGMIMIGLLGMISSSLVKNSAQLLMPWQPKSVKKGGH